VSTTPTSNLPIETLASRFEVSLLTFLVREGLPTESENFQAALTSMATATCEKSQFGGDLKELFRFAATQMTRQSVKQTIRSIIEGVGAVCEPPIEVAMTLALGIAARSQDYAVLFDFRGAQIFGDIESDTTVRIRPQVLFGEYRIDLLVSMQLIEGPENEIRVINKLVVVEVTASTFIARRSKPAGIGNGTGICNRWGCRYCDLLARKFGEMCFAARDRYCRFC
jgi:hypothetical protein